MKNKLEKTIEIKNEMYIISIKFGGSMEDLEKVTYEKFKEQVCSRCELIFQLKGKKRLIENTLEKYQEMESISSQEEIVYKLGTEGVREVFKNACVYMDKCEEIKEYIENVEALEERLSRLLYYMMNNNLEKEVYYISSEVNPYYPMLFNRIIRCNRAKEATLQDKYDPKKIIESFKINNE